MSLLSPDLKIGIILAIFVILGTVPVKKGWCSEQVAL